MPQVKIPPPYQGSTLGQARVEVEGTTVRECIQAVGDRYPGFFDLVIDPNGEVHRFVQLFINGDEVDRTAVDTSVAEGDEVEVLAAVAGG